MRAPVVGAITEPLSHLGPRDTISFGCKEETQTSDLIVTYRAISLIIGKVNQEIWLKKYVFAGSRRPTDNPATAMLKMGRDYNTTMCHYWNMLVQ